MLDGPESSPARDEGGRYRVQSVERALDTLDVLEAAGPDGATLSEIARRLGASKSTVLAVLGTLAARGVVAEVGAGRARRYRLGLALARLGDRALAQVGLLDVALPALREMTDETGWTSRIGVLDDGYAVMIGRVDGPGIVRFQSNLASRELPHCSAIGKTLLAHLDDEHVATLVARTGLPARTATTITDEGSLLRELADIRLRGYAVEDEEDSIGVFCVGAAVYDHRNACVAGVSLTGLKQTLAPDGIGQLGAAVRRCASSISRSLGASL